MTSRIAFLPVVAVALVALAWTPLLAWWWNLFAIPNGFFLEGQKAFKQGG